MSLAILAMVKEDGQDVTIVRGKMTQAKCFHCKEDMPDVGKPMEALLLDRLPIFCSHDCANGFPDNGTEEFERKLQDLSDEL